MTSLDAAPEVERKDHLNDLPVILPVYVPMVCAGAGIWRSLACTGLSRFVLVRIRPGYASDEGQRTVTTMESEIACQCGLSLAPHAA